MASPNIPKGFENVPMGYFKGNEASKKILWTCDLGTCVGIVVTGTPQESGKTRFLFHYSLDYIKSNPQGTWSNFAAFVKASNMVDMKG